MENTDLLKSWENKQHQIIDKDNYTQLCVLPNTILGDSTPEQFEQFMLESFNVRIKFAEEVAVEVENIDRRDLFFYIHNDDIPKFAVRRLGTGIRWWEDVIDNRNHLVYSKDILKKYPKTW